MSFLLTSLTTPPGSWLQALFLLVVLEAPAALAFNRWWALGRRARAGGAATARHRAAQGRLALAGGLLFGLRALGLAAAVLIPAGTLDALVVLPPMERATSALTILLLLWALAFPDFSPWADIVVTAASGLLLAGMAAAWMLWDAAVAMGEPFYNGTLDETAWIIVSAALLLAGIWLLARRRTPGWRQGAALFGVLLLGQALEYLFPIAGLDAPAAVRWAELLVLPAAMLLLYQRAQAWPMREPGARAGAPLPTEAEAAELAQAAGPRFGIWSVVRQLAETFLIAALVYFAIEFSSGRFKVDGPSMQPTLYAGQFVLTDKLAYRIGRPQRGDIVVIHPDDPKFVGGGLDLIKRVIGLPGETISVSGGVVFINGRRYLEQYPLEPARYTGAWIVGANQYFVLGDNRNNSSDSHVWGPLDRSKLAGRALLVYWPPAAWSWIAHTPLAAASP